MHDDEFTKGRRGEFRGDFTRDTFDPLRHFSRVLMQQGRVQLDADWNEQVSILLHYLRALGADLMGPHGTPCDEDGNPGNGFYISVNDNNGNREIQIASGRYYVDGIRCENGEPVSLATQPYPPYTSEEIEEIQSQINNLQQPILVYLDVWERHVSYVEDDYIREKALGGPDSASRAQIVWQVKCHSVGSNDSEIDFKGFYNRFLTVIRNEIRPGTGRLRARAKRTEETQEPCLTQPEAKYRGPENQLYRVEIHRGGAVGNDSTPTFKWSRENASVIFPIVQLEGRILTLEHLGRDERFGLKPNDWVEIVDDDYILQNRAEELIQVESVDRENLQVVLKGDPPAAYGRDPAKHPYLRRWDHQGGDQKGIEVKEGAGDNGWIPLEDGIEIQFQSSANENVNEPIYHTGDYWLIPARVVTGDVEWPGPAENPRDLPAQGVEHHYAPLALISNGSAGYQVTDLRRQLIKLWE